MTITYININALLPVFAFSFHLLIGAEFNGVVAAAQVSGCNLLRVAA